MSAITAADFVEAVRDGQVAFLKLGGKRANTNYPVSAHEQSYKLSVGGATPLVRLAGRTLFNPSKLNPGETPSANINLESTSANTSLASFADAMDEALLALGRTDAAASIVGMLRDKGVDIAEVTDELITEGNKYPKIGGGAGKAIVPEVRKATLQQYTDKEGNDLAFVRLDIPKTSALDLHLVTENRTKIQASELAKRPLESVEDFEQLNEEVPSGSTAVVNCFVMLRVYASNDGFPRLKASLYAKRAQVETRKAEAAAEEANPTTLLSEFTGAFGGVEQDEAASKKRKLEV